MILYTKTGEKENMIQTGSITFSYTETSDGISITNAYPMNDEAGKVLPTTGPDIKRGYFDFLVAATTEGAPIQYEVYSTDVTDSVRKLDPNYLKVYLTNGVDGSEVPMIGYNQSTVPVYAQLDNSNGGKRLYSGTFTSSGSQRFRLRLWVADDYPTTGISETFKMKVNVRAVA